LGKAQQILASVFLKPSNEFQTDNSKKANFQKALQGGNLWGIHQEGSPLHFHENPDPKLIESWRKDPSVTVIKFPKVDS
jgi:hypothetical protein